jgi:hypothetical protein
VLERTNNNLVELLRRLALVVVVVLGAVKFAIVVDQHYPIHHWLAWRYASYWLLCGIWSVACLSVGARVVRLITANPLPADEELLFGFAAGVYVFAMSIFLGGVLAWFGPTFAIALPIFLIVVGWSALTSTLRRFRADFRRPHQPLSLLDVVGSGFGLIALAMIYLTILVPENAAFDARWYHLPMAEHYSAQGAIRRFPEGWIPGAYPQLASLTYTWAFLLPRSTLFDRVELAAHLEFTFLLATLAGLPVLVRRLVPGARSKSAWAVMFLFPGIFLYDASLSIGADHVLAFWCVPIYLSLVRVLAGPLIWRRCLLLALMLSGAALTKYQAGCLLLFPILAVGARTAFEVGRSLPLPFVQRTRLGSWLPGLLVLIGACVVFTAPHWLKNWLWYGDPLYPILHKHFSSRPWSADATAMFAAHIGENLWQPVQPTTTGKLIETFFALFTFSLEPHDWPNFHGKVPVFGSLFTFLVFALPFTKGGRRVWPIAACTLSGVFAWYWISHQDRYLQALLPWMAATSAAIMVLVWRSGLLARVALGGLILLQVAWGGDVYFIPGHAMVGSPIKAAVDLLSSGYRKEYQKRLQPYSPWPEIGASLPAGAKVLVHEYGDHLGLGAMTVSDGIPWQAGIHYATLGNPGAVYDLLSGMGVTHICTRSESAASYSIAGDLVFWEFVTKWAGNRRTFGVFELAQMPTRRPEPVNRSDVVMFAGCDTTYASGFYRLSDMAVLTTTTSKSDFPPPFKPLDERAGAAARDDVGFIVVETTCHPALSSEQSRGFALAVRRGSTQLWVREGGT